jgi:hypothetical protein
MNSKVIRRKRPWPNKVLSQHLSGGKIMKISIKIVAVLTEIRTQRFRNICLERCYCAIALYDAVSTAEIMTV